MEGDRFTDRLSGELSGTRVRGITVLASNARPGVEVVRYTTSTTQRIYLDQYALVAVLEGQLTMQYRRAALEARAGDLILLECGRTLVASAAGNAPSSSVAIFVDAPVLESMAAPEEGKAVPVEFDAVLVRGPVAARFCTSAWRASQHDRPGDDTHLFDAIRAVLVRHARALQAATGAGGGERPVSSPVHAAHRAADFLHVHVAEPVSLDALAHVACLSKFHLTRVFHSVYGVPPHAYQLQLRLAYAKRLIVRGVSVSSAAQTSGFAGPMHLYRHFRVRYGVAPGYYAPQRRAAGIAPGDAAASAILPRRD